LEAGLRHQLGPASESAHFRFRRWKRKFPLSNLEAGLSNVLRHQLGPASELGSANFPSRTPRPSTGATAGARGNSIAAGFGQGFRHAETQSAPGFGHCEGFRYAETQAPAQPRFRTRKRKIPLSNLEAQISAFEVRLRGVQARGNSIGAGVPPGVQARGNSIGAGVPPLRGVQVHGNSIAAGVPPLRGAQARGNSIGAGVRPLRGVQARFPEFQTVISTGSEAGPWWYIRSRSSPKLNRRGGSAVARGKAW